jgi:AraC-like DNA-binding protein
VLLTFVMHGRGLHYLGEDVYEERNGSLSITHYNEYHAIVTDDAGMQIINVYIDLERHPLPRLSAELRSVLGDILPQHPVFRNRLNRMMRIYFSHVAEPVGHLLAINDELTNQNIGWQSVARHHFAIFLTLCCREALNTGIVPAMHKGANLCIASQSRLEKLRRKLELNFKQQHKLSDLAQEAGMTPESLCRAFRRYTGLSISQYLIRRRIQEALLNLRNTDDKILSIALDCGFNDLSYFNRTFKRLIGQTPSNCRK